MKKMYFLAASLLISTQLRAQSIADFEWFNLPPESFDNGSAGTSNFSNGNITLTNYYDQQWSSWSGFAASNTTDILTPGMPNQYSAWPGSGADNSAHYGVLYYGGSIYCSGNSIITGFEISNSTYAGLSMRDGDGIGKQFGSPLNADGIVDGTNGEDFYKVWIFGRDIFTQQIDSMEYYLADYRFQDSTMDYIVDTWETIDFTATDLMLSDSIYFRLESSDNGVWGMNTPAYFVIDNIEMFDLLGIDDELVELNISTYPNPMTEQLIVTGEIGELSVFDMLGNKVYSIQHLGETYIDVSNWASGSYMIEVSSDKGIGRRKVVK